MCVSMCVRIESNAFKNIYLEFRGSGIFGIGDKDREKEVGEGEVEGKGLGERWLGNRHIVVSVSGVNGTKTGALAEKVGV